MPVIAAIKKHATKPLDVHLMIEKPERYIEEFAKVGADIITVHYESTVHLHRTLRQIKDAGCKAGIVFRIFVILARRFLRPHFWTHFHYLQIFGSFLG